MNDDARQIGSIVAQRIFRLVNAKEEALTRAALAQLRRGIGKTPGSIPEIWDITLGGIPDNLRGRGVKPSYGEWAIHVALTHFALHQQGKSLQEQCMNQNGATLGASVRRLVSAPDEETRIKRRFDKVATTNDFDELVHHLRGLIQLLKAGNIPLDYPTLAQELYSFQFEESRDGIRLRWGREFYRFQKSDEGEGGQING